MRFIDYRKYKQKNYSGMDNKDLKKKKICQSACIFLITMVIVILVSVVTIGGIYVRNSKISVNSDYITELDPMYKVNTNKLGIDVSDNGSVIIDINDYEEIQDKLGISLADTVLEDKNPYIYGTVQTDDSNFAIINLKNYILGDTSNYTYIPENKNSTYDHYIYDPGEEFYSPISLEVDIILSSDQEEIGWSEDFLGMYEYYDCYISEQEYRVLLLQETSDSRTAVDQNMINRIAIFVIDGIRYKLSGKTSFDNIKNIVNSML